MAVPFFFHWYVKVAVPVAVTLKVAVWPAYTEIFCGWAVMAGAASAGLTVRVTVLEVALPEPFVTTTLNVAPLSAMVVVCVA